MMDNRFLENRYIVNRIDSEHKDLIHDVSFDFFGKRMATCSSDQSVKVWDFTENDKWVCTASWKTHNASVWRVTWAHPDFGQVIATCSFDRTATVWEETVVATTSAEVNHIWMHKANIVESRTSIKDIKFAPKHLGLLLATCSANGIVRIYEAPDPMNLAQWSMQHQLNCKVSCCCISWNPSMYRRHSPMIAVGSDDATSTSGGKVFIFEFNEVSREWLKIHTIMKLNDPVNDVSFAPNMGRDHHILAVASQELYIYKLKDISTRDEASEQHSELNVDFTSFNEHICKVSRLTWNDLGTVLLSTGDDGKVMMWMANFVGVWKHVGMLRSSINEASESPPPSSPSHETQIITKNNRINFRRFIPNREPPVPRARDPRFDGAYY